MSIPDELSVPAGYASGLFDLKDRVAVVTGGGSGLGAAMSIGLAQVGVKVVIADVNAKGAAATHATIESQNGASVATTLDVTDRECRQRTRRPGGARLRTRRHPHQQRGLGVPLAGRGFPRG